MSAVPDHAFDRLARSARESPPPSTDRVVAFMQHATRENVRSLPPGETIGRFRVLSEVGRGGMSIVYRALDTSLGREVALKVLRFAGDGGLVERLQREAQATARLSHPHIVALHEAGADADLHYLVMELVEGESLASRLPSLEVPAGIAIVEKAARAVGYAHAQGVIHRDLKPSNILMNRGGDPIVTDFGLALRLEDRAALTATGAILGTPFYMAPEQIQGRRDIDGRADVYSLGVILYQILTGRVPFEGHNVMAVLAEALGGRLRRPRQIRPNLHVDLESICLKALEADRGYRYAGALELADDLARYLRGEMVRARPVGRLTRGARWARRRPWLVASLASAILLGIGTIVGGAAAISRSQEQAEFERKRNDEARWDRVREERARRVKIDGLVQRARKAMESGRFPEPNPHLEQLRALDPGNPALGEFEKLLVARVRLLIERARVAKEFQPREALQTLAQVLRLDPENIEAGTLAQEIRQTEQARFEDRLKGGREALEARPSEAKDQLRAALEIEPDHEEARRLRTAAESRAALFEVLRAGIQAARESLEQGDFTTARRKAGELRATARDERVEFAGAEARELEARVDRVEGLRKTFETEMASGNSAAARATLTGLRQAAPRHRELEALGARARELDEVLGLILRLDEGLARSEPPPEIFEDADSVRRMRAALEATRRYGSFREYRHLIRKVAMEEARAEISADARIRFALVVDGRSLGENAMDCPVRIGLVRRENAWKVSIYEEIR